jgi:hypothetical protein
VAASVINSVGFYRNSGYHEHDKMIGDKFAEFIRTKLRAALAESDKAVATLKSDLEAKTNHALLLEMRLRERTGEKTQ